MRSKSESEHVLVDVLVSCIHDWWNMFWSLVVSLVVLQGRGRTFQAFPSSGWSRHKHISPGQICFDCFPLIITQFIISRVLDSFLYRFRNRSHVELSTRIASHVPLLLVRIDNFFHKGLKKLLWLAYAQRPVLGSLKLAPIKYGKLFVLRAI